MNAVLKFFAPTFAFTLGFVGTLHAAGDRMPQHSQGTKSATEPDGHGERHRR